MSQQAPRANAGEILRAPSASAGKTQRPPSAIAAIAPTSPKRERGDDFTSPKRKRGRGPTSPKRKRGDVERQRRTQHSPSDRTIFVERSGLANGHDAIISGPRNDRSGTAGRLTLRGIACAVIRRCTPRHEFAACGRFLGRRWRSASPRWRLGLVKSSPRLRLGLVGVIPALAFGARRVIPALALGARGCSALVIRGWRYKMVRL